MTRRKRKNQAGTPAPVSGPELNQWAAHPNIRIRAGRACMAVAQAVHMMQRQAAAEREEQRARFQREVRDVQEQTANAIADWLDTQNDWDVADIREGAWLPPEPDESESLTPDTPPQPAVITEVQNPHPQQEPGAQTIIMPAPRPLVVL